VEQSFTNSYHCPDCKKDTQAWTFLEESESDVNYYWCFNSGTAVGMAKAQGDETPFRWWQAATPSLWEWARPRRSPTCALLLRTSFLHNISIQLPGMQSMDDMYTSRKSAS
jgi:hypothetical protein